MAFVRSVSGRSWDHWISIAFSLPVSLSLSFSLSLSLLTPSTYGPLRPEAATDERQYATGLQIKSFTIVPYFQISAPMRCAEGSNLDGFTAADINWTKVDAALGKTAAVQGEVHRYGIPRSDLKVTLDGVTIKPALALGGWVAFEASNDGAMLMGDLVLTEDEVSPVMLKLMQSGIEITALHNHLIRATPATL